MLLGEAQAVRVAEHRALGDAHERIVRLGEIAAGKMHVVGRDERQIVAIGQLDERPLDAVLDRQMMAHQLDVEAPGKERRQAQKHRFGRFGLAVGQQPADRPARAAGEAEEAGGLSFERRERELRLLAALGVEEGAAREMEEIAIARLVLRQQHDRIGRSGRPDPSRESDLAVEAAERQLAADDRLHAGVARRLRELQSAEQVAGIGHRHGRHGMGFGERRQLFHLDRARGQRIGGMGAQMDEVGMRHEAGLGGWHQHPTARAQAKSFFILLIYLRNFAWGGNWFVR